MSKSVAAGDQPKSDPKFIDAPILQFWKSVPMGSVRLIHGKDGEPGLDEPKPGPLPIGIPIARLMSRGILTANRLGIVISNPGDLRFVRLEILRNGKTVFKTKSVAVASKPGIAQVFMLGKSAVRLQDHYLPGNELGVVVDGPRLSDLSGGFAFLP